MADVRGFRAVSFTGPLEPVLAPPYDVLDEAEVSRLKASSPHNVVHLTRPGLDYEGAGATLRRWLAEGAWVEEPAPIMMVHETRFEGRTRRDLIAALRLEPYETGSVLRHELTHRGPKEDRLALFRATRASLEPLWFLYQGSPHLLSEAQLEDRISFSIGAEQHSLARIRDFESQSRLSAAFARLPVMIADGHHRYETSLAYSAEVGGGPDASSRFTVACLTDLADPGLSVLPTHRVLRSGLPVRGGRSVPDLNAALDAIRGQVAAAVYQAGSYQVFEFDGEVAVVELHRQVLDNLLGIRTAEEALLYTRDAEEAVRWVDEGLGIAAYLLGEPDLEAILQFARAGATMPQKATYFYPKPPSGMAMLLLDPARNISDGRPG